MSKTIPIELLEAIATNRCAVFAGAGLSKYSGLPTWNDLFKPLKRKLGLSRTYDLTIVAKIYEFKYSRKELIDHLNKRLKKIEQSPSEHHKLLCNIGIKTFITTNYDDLFEKAMQETGSTYISIVRNEDNCKCNDETNLIVKFHGDFSDESTMVITQDDYLEYKNKHFPLYSLMAQIILSKSILFIGYSVQDWDFRYLQNELLKYIKENPNKAYSLVRGLSKSKKSYLDSINVLPIDFKLWKKKKEDIADIRLINKDIDNKNSKEKNEDNDCLLNFLNDLKNKLGYYTGLHKEFHFNDEAMNRIITSTIQKSKKFNELKENDKLLACLEYEVYNSYLDEYQFNYQLPGWIPPRFEISDVIKTINYERKELNGAIIFKGISFWGPINYNNKQFKQKLKSLYEFSNVRNK
ncbi:MAG: hypothetical protein GY839_09365 [candidate division Zixibacteria bacterium]|nr:hypothetical protein [candidate division Zixibacteria bacterium]